MSTLYELTTELMVLLEMAEDADVDADTLADTMEAIEGEIEIKADGYAKVMKELDGRASILDAEIKRLKARKDAIKANKERIKHNLEDAMRATGKTKFKTDLFSFGIQKNPASLKIDDSVDIENVPSEFLYIPPIEINSEAVKEALKAGKELSWARLEQGESLRIR